MNILVIGPAKTGTTIISKTIHDAVPGAEFHMEPKGIDVFLKDSSEDGSRHVVKIIYEHWSKKPYSLKAVIHNELPLVFERLVAIVRDPRDEWISRMMYFAYDWAIRMSRQEKLEVSKLEQWVRFIGEVEHNPQNHSFLSMLDTLNRIFGSKLQVRGRRIDSYWAFCHNLPTHAHVLRYEDFVSGRMERLEQFLGLVLTVPASLGNLDRTMRSASFNNWKEIFKQEDIELFRQQCGDLMEARGYTDWELAPAARLDTTSYSGYLKRVLAAYLPAENVENPVPPARSVE
ncbi:MAG: sulfotransferase domain-containing protein [Thiothrix sp.]|nr:sulfotransferase domain-containing protein [Thiothrix sp.]HPQ94071.1 sulfotransferase domain-containing protein [Thiolinea sp.]